jgi:hypothetical protein
MSLAYTSWLFRAKEESSGPEPLARHGRAKEPVRPQNGWLPGTRNLVGSGAAARGRRSVRGFEGAAQHREL